METSKRARRRKLKPDWKIDWSICTTGYTVEPIGPNPHDESIFRRPMGGNARWASRRWKTRSSSRPW
jgi:hypothetical protein